MKNLLQQIEESGRLGASLSFQMSKQQRAKVREEALAAGHVAGQCVGEDMSDLDKKARWVIGQFIKLVDEQGRAPMTLAMVSDHARWTLADLEKTG